MGPGRGGVSRAARLRGGQRLAPRLERLLIRRHRPLVLRLLRQRSDGLLERRTRRGQRGLEIGTASCLGLGGGGRPRPLAATADRLPADRGLRLCCRLILLLALALLRLELRHQRLRLRIICCRLLLLVTNRFESRAGSSLMSHRHHGARLFSCGHEKVYHEAKGIIGLPNHQLSDHLLQDRNRPAASHKLVRRMEPCTTSGRQHDVMAGTVGAERLPCGHWWEPPRSLSASEQPAR